MGIFCGDSKPGSLTEFLEPYLAEISDLHQNGFKHGNKIFVCKLNGPYIMDTPARSYVKCTKGHTGYYSCDKCSIRGFRYKQRTLFLEAENEEESISLRTDTSFRNQQNEGHHLVGQPSPLERLTIDMVNQFPLDYMHLVCLGAMRRMANCWAKKGRRYVRLSTQMILEFSSRLESSRKHIPTEFARKPRALKYIDRWKATELRQFLLYTGPILGEGILSEDVLKHFRMLFCAIYILASPELSQTLCDYAGELLELFVASSPDFYGKEFVVLNIHSLKHLASDVKRFGPLDAFSAFPFENHLQLLKKKMRSPNKPLQQLFKRVNEREFLVEKKCVKQLVLKREFKSNNPDMPINSRSFKKLETPLFIVSTHSGDNVFKLITGAVIKVSQIYQTSQKDIMVVGNLCKFVDDIFDYPLRSSILGIFKAKISRHPKTYPLSALKRKCFLYPCRTSKFVNIVPLLHSS